MFKTVDKMSKNINAKNYENKKLKMQNRKK